MKATSFLCSLTHRRCMMNKLTNELEDSDYTINDDLKSKLKRLTKVDLIEIVIKQLTVIQGFEMKNAERGARIELEHQIAFPRKKVGTE